MIFVLPAPSARFASRYARLTHEAAKRVMYDMYKDFARAVPFRVAFYTAWNQIAPPMARICSIASSAKSLQRCNRQAPLVVPFASVFKDFDTEHILPTLVESSLVRCFGLLSLHLAACFTEKRPTFEAKRCRRQFAGEHVCRVSQDAASRHRRSLASTRAAQPVRSSVCTRTLERLKPQ